MSRRRWLAVGGLLLLAGGAGILWAIVPKDEDPCLAGGRSPTRVRPANSYIFSCADAVYLPTADARVRFKRVDALRASEIEVLPHKYLRTADELYYVALVGVGWEETEYELRVIDGVDLPTLEILQERRVQDKNNVYAVMNDHVTVTPRE